MLRAVLLALILLIAQPISTAYADSLREVAERVARQNDAKLVSAREVTDRDGQKVYVIRILTRDGVVRTIRVPARGRHHQIASISSHWQIELSTADGTHANWQTYSHDMLHIEYSAQGTWA